MSTDTAAIFPDSDTLQIVKYLTFQLSAEAVVAFEDRLATDIAFRMYALPLIVVWTIPHPLAARGFLRGFRLRRSNPNSMKSRQREWARLFRAASMKPQPMAKVLDDAFHPPRRGKRKFWTSLGLGAVVLVLWLAIWWRIAQRDTLEGRSVPTNTVLTGARFYGAATTTRTVTRAGATFTVHPSSRLVIAFLQRVAAMDGDVDIVVHPGNTLMIQPAGLMTKLVPGRYHVSHPLGNTTRIVVDSGLMAIAPLANPGSLATFITFKTGAAITAVQHEKLTTLSVIYKDGTVVEPVTVRNTGIRP